MKKLILFLSLISVNAFAISLTERGFIDTVVLNSTQVKVAVKINPATMLPHNDYDDNSRIKNLKIESEILNKSGVPAIDLDVKLKLIPFEKGIAVYMRKVVCGLCKYEPIGLLEMETLSKDGWVQVKTLLPFNVQISRQGLYNNSQDIYTAAIRTPGRIFTFGPDFGHSRSKLNLDGWQRKEVDFASKWLQLFL